MIKLMIAMYIVTSLLILLLCLKLLAIGNAIRWLINQGISYRQYCEKNRPFQPSDFFGAFEQHKANFFPFGFKDYRLRKFVSEQKLGIIRLVAGLFQNVLFRFNRLITMVCLYLLIAAATTNAPTFTAIAPPKWMLCVLTLLMLIGNIALSTEAIVSYTILGNYAVLFHMMTPSDKVWDAADLRLNEVRVFAARFFASIGSGSVAVFVIHALYESFSKLPKYSPSSICNWFQLWFDSLYFTLTTFLTVGYGDILPQNRLGQFIAVLIMIQGFMLIVGVFASLQSSRFEKLTP